MELQLISDIHLNFGDLSLPGGDVLVMAGDIMEAGHLRLSDNTAKYTNTAATYRRFIAEELPKYKHVLYVLGNHEHYHEKYENTRARLEKELPAHVHILENESVEIDGYVIFGATLWTDCNRGDPLTLMDLSTQMSDYSCIKHARGYKKTGVDGNVHYASKFTPADTRRIHANTLNVLENVCATNDDKKIVIVTHHAPTFASIGERYRGDGVLNGGYASDLSEFILDRPNICAWLHGHIHDAVDYMVGDTRVLSNPRGYIPYETDGAEYSPLIINL